MAGLGNFASGLAQGFTSTYSTLSDIERRKQESERAERALKMQEAEFNQKQDEKRRTDEAAALTLGRVGKDIYSGDLQKDAGVGAQQAQGLKVDSGDANFDQLVANSDADTLRQNAQRQNAALPDVPKYTRAQAEKDYADRLAAIDPAKAQAYRAGALAIEEGERKNRYGANTEMALGFQKNILDDLAKNKGDVGAVIEKHFLPLYNDNKLPGLNDGGTAKLVPNAMGGGQTIVITGKDGKEQTLPADINTLQMLTGEAQKLMMASSSPEAYWKHRESHLKEKEVGLKEKELDEKVKAGLWKSEAAKNNAAASRDVAHAGVYNNMLKLAKDNAAAGEAMKPYIEKFNALTPEQQQGSEGQAILTQGAVAAARKTGDITGIINSLKKPDKSGVESAWMDIEKDLYKQGMKPADIDASRTQFYASRGFAPQAAVAAIQVGKLNGKPMTEADVDSFNTRFPNSAVDKSKLPWLKSSAKTTAGAATSDAPTQAIPAGAQTGEQLLQRETREIEQGKRRDYSPEVRAYIDAQDAARRKANDDYAARERERALAASRNAALNVR